MKGKSQFEVSHITIDQRTSSKIFINPQMYTEIAYCKIVNSILTKKMQLKKNKYQINL